MLCIFYNKKEIIKKRPSISRLKNLKIDSLLLCFLYYLLSFLKFDYLHESRYMRHYAICCW